MVTTCLVIAVVVLLLIVVVMLCVGGPSGISSGFASLKERLNGKPKVTKLDTGLPLPPSGATVAKSSYRPIKKATDDHLNMIISEGMTGGPFVPGENPDSSPFKDVADQNQTLSHSALTGEQRAAHRNFVRKRMVYPRTAATPDDSIEYVSDWRGLRMPGWVNPNKTNPSSVYEVPNEETLKDIRRKRYDARI